MSARRATPRMTERVAAVRAARERLQDKHLMWILEGAFEHFVSAAKKTELDLVRYAAHPDRPIFTPYGKDRGSDGQGATRAGEVSALRERLDQYYAILEFLQALKDAELVRSAEAFVAEFAGIGVRARGSGRGVRST